MAARPQVDRRRAAEAVRAEGDQPEGDQPEGD